MNGYIAFYNGKQVEVYADSLYAAKLEAIKMLNVKKKNEYQVSVHLAEKNGEQVVHVADM